MNSTWASEPFLSDVGLFILYFFVTLIVEFGVFSLYMIQSKLEKEREWEVFFMLMLANLLSFVVGFSLFVFNSMGGFY